MSAWRAGELERHLARTIREGEWFGEGDPVVVALSGGVDSLALLDLLHEGLDRVDPARPRFDLHPAHFDHRMRAGSTDEADRLEAVMKRWGLPLHRGVAPDPPSSETGARDLRFRFLRGVLDEVGARWILLGHHADDQRETVLFRILRGTGIRGLRGMQVCRPPDLLRPLLEVDRAVIRAYAERRGLEPLEDPSNRDPAFARNRIRHELLPLAREIHPGASAGLLRLSRRAREVEEVLDALLAPEVERILERGRIAAGTLGGGERPGEIAVARDDLLSYPPPVRSELLRTVAERLGSRLSEAGTGTVLEFISEGSSGGWVELPGSVLLSRDFSLLRFRRRGPDTRDRGGAAEVLIPLARSGAGSGSTEIRLGGSHWRVDWGMGGLDDGAQPSGAPTSHDRGDARWTAAFRHRDLHPPLRVRGRKPGDRVPLGVGRKKLKKLLGELRIPRGDRDRLPLLVDGSGLVLWIPGHWRAPLADPGTLSETWTIGVTDVGDGA
ncbi:MAG: tRNA lysidine(34) synthetase TilS [Gemmatimonadales bacterium]|nr:MAG: tRNA lysidine(34) synthetase TilS [Gemmatimonadales bacterium]